MFDLTQGEISEVVDRARRSAPMNGEAIVATLFAPDPVRAPAPGGQQASAEPPELPHWLRPPVGAGLLSVKVEEPVAEVHASFDADWPLPQWLEPSPA